MNRAYCFWSHDQQYRKMAEFCAASFERFGFPVTVTELQTRSDWMRNCMSRAQALLDLSHEFPCDTLTMFDADLTCVSNPNDVRNFCETKGDICLHDKGVKAPQSVRYCPGIISFAPSTLGHECLNLWAARCKDDPTPWERLREQLYLNHVIESLRPKGLKVFALSDQYNLVDNPAVIIHHVASRKLREVVGGRM